MKAFVILAIVACSLLLSGCVFVKIKDGSFPKSGQHVAGNGVIVEKTFEVGAFSRIELGVPADVSYSKSDDCSLSVSMDENLFEYLTVSVEDGVLKLGSKGVSLRNFKKLAMSVSSPTLERLECNGAVDFVSDGPVCGEEFVMKVNGAADVDLASLEVKTARFEVNGAADLDVRVVDAESVSLSISGAGDAKLSGKTKEVEVTVSGAGDVDLSRLEYDNLSKKVSGMGTVKTGSKARS